MISLNFFFLNSFYEQLDLLNISLNSITLPADRTNWNKVAYFPLVFLAALFFQFVNEKHLASILDFSFPILRPCLQSSASYKKYNDLTYNFRLSDSFIVLYPIRIFALTKPKH